MQRLEEEVIKSTGALKVIRIETVQTLWSGYGEIKRYFLKGGKLPSVIVKHILWPDDRNHPKGWNTERSHQRKLTSYQVERNWYQYFAMKTDQTCKIPQIYHAIEEGKEILLIMEDLDASGFDVRLDPEQVTLNDAKNCLTWLACFHGKFMKTAPEGLWETGTYWHLATRPEELEKMDNLKLKHVAPAIDARLSNAQFQTLVHGDAKLANFCFSKTNEIAAVDFQYVGKGCGMKDIAYLISSCFDEETSERYEKELLEHYFQQLEIALVKPDDFQLLKEEWSTLYKYAWGDFYRFLDGWSPGHWKMHKYSERLTAQVIAELVTK